MLYRILNSTLLGDVISTLPAIKKFKASHPKDRVEYIVSPAGAVTAAGQASNIKKLENSEYLNIINGVPYIDSIKFVEVPDLIKLARHPNIKNLRTTVALDSMTALNFGAKANANIIYGYGPQLGVNVTDIKPDLRLTDTELNAGKEFVEQYDKPVIILSRLSHSCTRYDPVIKRPNKTLEEDIWLEFINSVKERYKIIAVGTPNEPKLDGVDFLSVPIRELAGIIANSKMAITIDNGVGWLAAALSVPHLFVSCAMNPAVINHEYNPAPHKMISKRVPEVTLEDISLGFADVISRA